MEIIGHRGAKGLAPENSLKAIKFALELGVDIIELDVRVHSNQLVLSHDETIRNGDYCKLSDALKLIQDKTKINLEIKESKVVDLLPEVVSKFKNNIIYSSFKFSILQEIRNLLPDSEIAVLEKWSGIRAVAQATRLGTKRIHINQNWLWSNFVRSMVSQGFELYAYTVNDVERAKELESWGVKGICTDYPDRFKDFKVAS